MARDTLDGARVVLGVTGGIAAYKAVEVSRKLVDQGAHVIPILTKGATRFVGETTFSALGSERAHVSINEDSEIIPHTSIGKSADLIIVAPATARLIGAYAAGISSDLLSATLLATRAPVIICPAMHTEMWEHPAVIENIATLKRRGVEIVEPVSGRLAGGDLGSGRLADPATIVAYAKRQLAKRAFWETKRILVTAGGTREPIDPVRFISNRSSGKQGHALAFEAWIRGAQVTLVTSTKIDPPPGIEVIFVETAREMQSACEKVAPECDVVIMAAAVADFQPSEVSALKISRSSPISEIKLEPAPDILAGLVTMRDRASTSGETTGKGRQILVGFAAETHDVVQKANAKLEAKGVDLLVANDVSAPGVGFDHDTNAVLILDRNGGRSEVEITDKNSIARAVLNCIEKYQN